MATTTSIPPNPVVAAQLPSAAGPDRGPTCFSPILLAFDALLMALRAFVEAERDLSGVDLWDLACRVWRDDADAALSQLNERIRVIRGLGEEMPADRPMMRMTLLLDLMLGVQTPEEFSRAHGLLDRYATLFSCCDTDPVADRVNALLMRGRDLIGAMAEVSLQVDPYDAPVLLREPADVPSDTW